MFDFSFYELLVFGVIALIVLGPEKLPQAVRTMGTYYAKFRRTVGTIKAEMEAELDLAETRQLMQQELAKIRQTEAQMKQEMDQLRDSMQEFEQQQNSQLKQTLNADGSTSENGLTTDTAATDSHSLEYSNVDSSKVDDVNNDKPHHVSAHRNYEDSWVHPVAGANPVTATTAAGLTTAAATDSEAVTEDHVSAASNSAQSTRYQHNTADDWQLPMTRPWENMWFLLGEYDRVRRLPPAPFLPNYKANPLLYMLPKNSNVQSATEQANNSTDTDSSTPLSTASSEAKS
ncbi:Sec-independent protein translocase protein TatB [Psychrobacter sp. FDAARGOS_221]|uniref:Sec-independent protein translocase protein TatB n=1 Tax=Psychrobacter sp. FDAARGOS_221 TaxID=1975705 RepID=UPI000BB58292|nr:Sec-independent protein translocase protein TatB [Psychrobacter sp. FDAARGOS_221]PNK60690.1 twin-arginine translocase subunit TatB [Psychrobacter sp. FDAARGOS_221]